MHSLYRIIMANHTLFLLYYTATYSGVDIRDLKNIYICWLLLF